MKLVELVPHPQYKLNDLKREIESGELVLISTEGGERSFKALEKLGWAHQEKKTVEKGTTSCWAYTGPGKIKVGSTVMKKGDKTEPIWNGEKK